MDPGVVMASAYDGGGGIADNDGERYSDFPPLICHKADAQTRRSSLSLD